MPKERDERDFGKFCVFLSRSCGAFSSIIVLLCGFIALVPVPPAIIGGWGQCLAAGLSLIVAAVVMFFLEASVIGHCVERFAFLLVINQRLQHWMRTLIYFAFAVIPLAVVCLSASTIIGLCTVFLVGAINFVLAVGHKGDHQEKYDKMKMTELEYMEEGSDHEEEVVYDGTAKKLKESDL